ncbi:MAG TPA: DUF6282 family protein [Candidatus Methylomirabilis sp.]
MADITRRVRDLMHGAVDLHTHSSPDLFPRVCDHVELVTAAARVGMRGIVLKSHFATTTFVAALVQKGVRDVAVFGGIVLNRWVGGLNPDAVDMAIASGARQVWMPTLSSRNHLQYYGESQFRVQKTSRALRRSPGDGITVFGPDGRLLPEVEPILDLIAHGDVILGTGHLTVPETVAVVREARRRGVRRILVTHADFEVNRIPLETQVELAGEGALIEKCLLTVMPGWASTTMERIAADIQALGPERCVLVTDFGQANHPNPVEGMADFIRQLVDRGVSEGAIHTMANSNPRRLLGLP